MNTRSVIANAIETLVYTGCAMLPIIAFFVAFWFMSTAKKEANEVANEVANKVTNTVPNMVTETEVYKIVCTSDGEGYCKEYSVRKINRE